MSKEHSGKRRFPSILVYVSKTKWAFAHPYLHDLRFLHVTHLTPTYFPVHIFNSFPGHLSHLDGAWNQSSVIPQLLPAPHSVPCTSLSLEKAEYSQRCWLWPGQPMSAFTSSSIVADLSIGALIQTDVTKIEICPIAGISQSLSKKNHTRREARKTESATKLC